MWIIIKKYKINKPIIATLFQSLITAMLGFFACLVLMLIIAVVIWLPRNAGINPMLHWAPKYRSLGKPYTVPHYVRYDPDHWPDKPMYVQLTFWILNQIFYAFLLLFYSILIKYFFVLTNFFILWFHLYSRALNFVVLLLQSVSWCFN